MPEMASGWVGAFAWLARSSSWLEWQKSDGIMMHIMV
jgi:hypothetical protein